MPGGRQVGVPVPLLQGPFGVAANVGGRGKGSEDPVGLIRLFGLGIDWIRSRDPEALSHPSGGGEVVDLADATRAADECGSLFHRPLDREVGPAMLPGVRVRVLVPLRFRV